MKFIAILLGLTFFVCLEAHAEGLPSECGDVVTSAEINSYERYLKDNNINCLNMGDQRSINSCSTLGSMKSEIELQKAYEKISQELKKSTALYSADSVELLKKAQKSWCIYRDDSCREDSDLSGSMSAELSGDCLKERNIKRSSAFIKWADCLENNNCGGGAILFYPIETEAK